MVLMYPHVNLQFNSCKQDREAAAEPAAGGIGDAGREQRESIDRQSRLMKVLAG